MAIGLACGDGETPWKGRTGKRDDDDVSGDKITCPADDSVHAAVGRSHIHLTPANGLLEFCELLDLKNLAHHEIPDDTAADRLDGFDLKASTDQTLGDISTRLIGGNVDKFAKP